MKYIFFIFPLFLLQDCSNSNTTTSETSKVNPPPEVTQTEPSLSAVYEHFDSLEHIFNFQNDTTYVINFWATWCKPCVEELPYFEKLTEEYADQKLKVILVSMDAKKHIETKLKPFIQREQLKSEVIALTDIDYNTWIDKVEPEWDGAIPVTLVYNAEEYEFIGGEVADYEELQSIIKSFIKS